jgi:hypothetical protein
MKPVSIPRSGKPCATRSVAQANRRYRRARYTVLAAIEFGPRQADGGRIGSARFHKFRPMQHLPIFWQRQGCEQCRWSPSLPLARPCAERTGFAQDLRRARPPPLSPTSWPDLIPRHLGGSRGPALGACKSSASAPHSFARRPTGRPVLRPWRPFSHPWVRPPGLPLLPRCRHAIRTARNSV